MTRLLKLFLLLFSLVTFGFEVRAADSPAKPSKTPLTKTRVSLSALNPRAAVIWVAQAQDIFTRHGLEVETILLQSSNLQTAALATGEVQIGTIGGATALSAVAGGQDFKIVASPSNQLPYDLVVRPEIKEAKDMRGKRVGVASVGGTTWMAAILGLQHFGLDLNRDSIQINAIGNQSIQAQALEAGNIDMIVVDPFFSRRLKQKGFRIMLELYRVNIPFITTSIVVRGAYLRDHEDIVENFLKALLETQAFVASPGNRNAVIKTVATHLKIKDPLLAEEGYQDLLLGIERKPYPSIESLRNIQKMMAALNPKVAKVRAEEVIDARIIRKLDESGFIDGLYDSRKR